MSLLGISLGGPGCSPPPPSPPPSAPPGPPPATSSDASGDSTSGSPGGSTAGASGSATSGAGPSADPGTPDGPGPAARPGPAAGTPVTAPATRRDFGAAAGSPEDAAAARAAQRTWRLSDVMAAIGGGPAAIQLIERANRPGPAAPGSLLEAVKMLCPAPDAPRSSRAV